MREEDYMLKKIKFIKKIYINLENKMLCLFIIFFAIINIFFSLFLHTSCRGIAYGDQGKYAIGMESIFGSNTIFFYNKNGKLIQSVDINNDGRSQAKMSCNSKKISYQVYKNIYYFDYNGTELNDIIESENIDGELITCEYVIENNVLSITHKKYLGLEYIIYNGIEKQVHIYFKFFFIKMLWLLLMSPFIMFVIKTIKKSINEIHHENIT